MRLHVEDRNGSDPYKAYLAENAVVVFNGEIIKNCIEADEEMGFVVVYISKDDPRYNAKMYFQRYNELHVETLLGDVQILDPEAVSRVLV